MQSGKFIVFEGISGTGKETEAKLLQKYLCQKGITARIVYHPSPELKTILSVWRKERKIDHITETYLLLADRYDRVTQSIRPALAKGEWVISLRSYLSALVYQGKTNSECTWISQEFFRFEPKPDYLFYFDIPPASAIKRIMIRYRQTGERLGKFETQELLTEKRNAYRKALSKIAHIYIDASQNIGALHKQIIRALNFKI